MSVIAFDTGFFGQVATDLKVYDGFKLTLDDKQDYAFAFSDVSEETYLGRIINSSSTARAASLHQTLSPSLPTDVRSRRQ